MSITYSIPAINARLLGVNNAVGDAGNGFLILLAGAVHVSTIQLANPMGTVDNGVLTFSGTLLDVAAAATGFVTSAIITDALGVIMVSGLTVGVPPTPGYDIYISNGLNTTQIAAGQTVQVLSAQITGS